jgi:hypothetical protein
MKKFDFLLLIIACGLISFGFYFSKKFKSDSESEFDVKTKNQISKTQSSRLPSQVPSAQVKPVGNEEQEATPALSLDQQYKDKYLSLKNCIATQDCDFPQDDPRSYEIEIHREINRHLQDVGQVSEGLKRKVLISAARFSDGYIKETVLRQLVKDKLYSEEWRDLVLNEFISHHNPRLIPEAIEYLKEYSSENDQNLIHQRIFTEISNGSPKVANALAENLKALLNEKSATYYKSQISNLEEGPIKNNLNREIIDFEMQSSAG